MLLYMAYLDHILSRCVCNIYILPYTYITVIKYKFQYKESLYGEIPTVLTISLTTLWYDWILDSHANLVTTTLWQWLCSSQIEIFWILYLSKFSKYAW
jgi:hypothetical protein